MTTQQRERRKERMEWHRKNASLVLGMISMWKMHDPRRESARYMKWLEG